MSATLSKKKQKALLFRQQAKAKKTGEALPGDVPEQDAPEDDIDGADAVVVQTASTKNGESSTASLTKKRKRQGEEGKADCSTAQDLTGGIKGKAQAVGKGKGKAWDDADGEEGGKAGKKSKKEVKQRFILFIGGSSVPHFMVPRY